ncbi:MAG: hypothetical protein GF331_17550 [Chitinivibrionales bacterium]|nr:hypothetical protein [Chitinivibrionales bacterium]
MTSKHGKPRPTNKTTPPLKPLTVIGVALVLLGLLLTGVGMLSSRIVLYVGWGLCLTGAALQVADWLGLRSRGGWKQN